MHQNDAEEARLNETSMEAGVVCNSIMPALCHAGRDWSVADSVRF